MKDDSIIAEVRRIRDEYARQFNYDLWAIYEDLKREEKESGRTIVNRSGKRQTPEGGARIPDGAKT